jgi:hypothetical protein
LKVPAAITPPGVLRQFQARLELGVVFCRALGGNSGSSEKCVSNANWMKPEFCCFNGAGTAFSGNF